jgi:hypothetical protein
MKEICIASLKERMQKMRIYKHLLMFPVFGIFILLAVASASTPSTTSSGSSSNKSTGVMADTFVAGQFKIPANAELLESTEFKNDGIPYMIEQRYKLPSGQIMYAYYDVEGSNSVTVQKIEQAPLLSIGTDINIPGLPGYREFNFRDDRRKLVQFMKLFKLGQPDYSGKKAKTPSLSDRIFSSISNWKNDFKLLLDLYDETWVLEHRQYSEGRLVTTDTTAIIRVNKYSE